MVHTCSAYKCTRRYKKDGSIPVSFHNFPKDKVIRDKWIHEMNRKNWKPSISSKLCSLHFTESCYDTSQWSSQRRLKPDAIPTIFDFPEHKKETTLFRRSPKPAICLSPVDIKKEEIVFELPPPPEEYIVGEVDTPRFKKRKYYVGDYLKDESLNDSMSSPQLADFMRISQKTIEKKNKQLRILRQELRRAKTKIKTLETIIIDQKEKNLANNKPSEVVIVMV